MAPQLPTVAQRLLQRPPAAASPAFKTTLSFRPPTSSSIYPVLSSMPCRYYRRHMWHVTPPPGNVGRSVAVKGGNPLQAWNRLRQILDESKIRETAKRQERFERNHDKKRRRAREIEWRWVKLKVSEQVKMAYDLKRRMEQEKANYKDI
ncbi:hypothetical protein HK104_004463 [Borealophlyctis nickersoniae]|nr:hypothetical protein HK104_004463 [Borealophlyctis nickersoniae]